MKFFKRWQVLEHYEHNDGQVTTTTLGTFWALKSAEMAVELAKDDDLLFENECYYSYSIVRV